MDIPDRDFLIFLANPRESLAVEIKQWIDPTSPEGTAKIAKACIALRNSNGGRLVIGYKDDTSPDCENAPPDPRVSFHVDAIQTIVSRYSAELFSIDVQFYDVHGQTVPVIVVPPGVRTPVAAKADLRDSNNKSLIRDHAVYVRSLQSNNVVSSTEARRGDWDVLTRTCFDNREADIGGFVRRHLSALNLDALTLLFPSLSAATNRPSPRERIAEELDRGRLRFDAAMVKKNTPMPKLGLRESAILIEGDFPPQNVTRSFLDKLLSNAPRYTGLPPWTDLHNDPDRPYVLDHGWQALLLDLDPTQARGWPDLDFWRIEPRGAFYHLRALEDDLAGKRGPAPGTRLDFLLQIARNAEVMLSGLSFGRSLGCDETKTSLVFGFRWNGLLDRQLSSWVEPRYSLFSRGLSNQDTITTVVTVPLESPQNSIYKHVENSVKDLFALFGGIEIGSDLVEELVSQTLSRKM